MSAKEYYIDIEVEKGGKAILNGGIFESVTGNGEIEIAKNVVVRADGGEVPATPATPTTPAAPAGEAGVAFQSYTGSDGNSGTSADYPKKTFGSAKQTGVMSVLPNGGTLVVVGKGYIGGDYTFPAVPLTITSVYGGVDYKNPEPANNPNCAVKIASGKTVTIASEVTFDNVILFQEASQNVIRVTKGGVLTVTDTVELMSKTEYHFKVVVEEGGKAILSEEAKSTFSLSNQGGTIETYVSSTPATPATPTEKTEIKLTIGSKTGYVNGAAKELDAAPLIKNGRTMLPVRFVAENLGGTVGWDGATSSVTITAPGIDIAIKVGASTATINGYTVTLDAPAFIESSRTYLPVRVVAEAMGATVAWDGATSTATLTKS